MLDVHQVFHAEIVASPGENDEVLDLARVSLAPRCRSPSGVQLQTRASESEVISDSERVVGVGRGGCLAYPRLRF